MKQFPRTFFVLILSLPAFLRADPGPLELWSPTPATAWQQEANMSVDCGVCSLSFFVRRPYSGRKFVSSIVLV